MSAGINQPIPLEDAYDICGMLVTLGRAVPPSKWVDELRIRADGEAMFGMFGI